MTRYADKSYNLRVNLDTNNCELTPANIAAIEADLEPLRRLTERFPVSDLYITIEEFSGTEQYHVRTALVLPGKTLFTGERSDEHAVPAFGACARKLVKKLQGYIMELDGGGERAHYSSGTKHDVIPSEEPDAVAVQSAIDEADYAKFREAMYPYEESLRTRIGRWVQRYPQVQQQIGTEFQLADIVEEVFLNAFDNWNSRPEQVPVGRWIEDLIDPSIKALLDNPEEEMANIAMVRTYQAESQRK